MQVSDHRKINYDFAIFFEPRYFLSCKEWFKSARCYNHGQKSLGQSERNFNSMRFTSSVAKSSAVFLQIHVPSPLPTQYNVERSKELCLDGFNTVCGVGGGGRDVQC